MRFAIAKKTRNTYNIDGPRGIGQRENFQCALFSLKQRLVFLLYHDINNGSPGKTAHRARHVPPTQERRQEGLESPLAPHHRYLHHQEGLHTEQIAPW